MEAQGQGQRVPYNGGCTYSVKCMLETTLKHAIEHRVGRGSNARRVRRRFEMSKAGDLAWAQDGVTELKFSQPVSPESQHRLCVPLSWPTKDCPSRLPGPGAVGPTPAAFTPHGNSRRAWVLCLFLFIFNYWLCPLGHSPRLYSHSDIWTLNW